MLKSEVEEGFIAQKTCDGESSELSVFSCKFSVSEKGKDNEEYAEARRGKRNHKRRR
jgi:hypothetical protein